MVFAVRVKIQAFHNMVFLPILSIYNIYIYIGCCPGVLYAQDGFPHDSASFMRVTFHNTVCVGRQELEQFKAPQLGIAT